MSTFDRKKSEQSKEKENTKNTNCHLILSKLRKRHIKKRYIELYFQLLKIILVQADYISINFNSIKLVLQSLMLRI